MHTFGDETSPKQPEAAVAVLHNDAVPFYDEQGLKHSAVLTTGGTEFCGPPEHPDELYLALSEIEHRTTKVARRRRTASSSGLIGP